MTEALQWRHTSWQPDINRLADQLLQPTRGMTVQCTVPVGPQDITKWPRLLTSAVGQCSDVVPIVCHNASDGRAAGVREARVRGHSMHMWWDADDSPSSEWDQTWTCALQSVCGGAVLCSATGQYTCDLSGRVLHKQCTTAVPTVWSSELISRPPEPPRCILMRTELALAIPWRSDLCSDLDGTGAAGGEDVSWWLRWLWLQDQLLSTGKFSGVIGTEITGHRYIWYRKPASQRWWTGRRLDELLRQEWQRKI